MPDCCCEHNIPSDVEVIPIHRINKADERMLRQGAKYRFVIDMGSLCRLHDCKLQETILHATGGGS